MDLLNLPEHILIKVCNKLRLKDLLKLTRTCHHFNELVANTNDLVKRITFTISISDDQRFALESIRRYQNIFMKLEENFYRKSQSLLLLKFSPFLQELKVDGNFTNTIDVDLLLSSLKSSNTIKVIKFYRACCNGLVPNQNYDTFNISSLQELHIIQADCRLVNCFQQMQLKKVVLSINDSYPMNVDILFRFLASQTSLKHIHLNAESSSIIFNSNIAKDFDFCLEEIKLFLCYITSDQAKHLNKFLRKQEKSLKSVEVEVEKFHSPQNIATVLHLVEVKKVSLNFFNLVPYDSSFFGQFASVTHLTVETKNEMNEQLVLTFKHFYNVIELTLINTQLNSSLDFKKFFLKMRSLKLFDVRMTEFQNIPQVTEVSFGSEFFEAIAKFLQMNKQILKLKISGHSHPHAGYLMVILKKNKNLEQIDMSELKDIDEMCMTTIRDFGGFLYTLILPYNQKHTHLLRKTICHLVFK